MSRLKQYLYKLTFPNGKVYIGVTNDIERRWSLDGYHYKSMFVWDAISEFGWDNIKKEILLHLPESQENSDTIVRLERELILAYGDNSYNVDKKALVGKLSEVIWCDGEGKTYSRWAKDPRVWVCAETIRRRIEDEGWMVRDAIFTPSLTTICGDPTRRKMMAKSYRDKAKVV